MNITKDVINAIIDHAKREIPYEACGCLAEKDGIVSHYYELTNIDKAADHFSMDPKEQFAAIRDMRGKGLKLAGIYHSHPETPARPSEEDIRLAYDPEVSYVIVSLIEPDCSVKSFKIRNGVVTMEEINIIDHKKEPQIKIDAVKNCQGISCPMNLVYTKVELAKLRSGQVLEVILDDGAPAINVPLSASKEGHKILAKNQLTKESWSVLLEKA
ncbi:MAG: Mov34/MPN/PAD-1 family protein [Desulfobulbaceae bacterium]|nr:Mov34/MPN/PAD-1 family protein [Desulfobulbaceae bacterium]